MARPSHVLTLDDLRILSRIAKGRPDSHAAAARLVGFDRSRLSRLIERVNAHIGEEHLEWRYEGRFSLPPEARRIAAAFDEFDARLTDVVGTPRISAGATASLLLLRLLRGQRHLHHPLVLVLRSADIVEALKSDHIDVAFVNNAASLFRGSGISFTLNGESQQVSADVEAQAVLEWRPCLIQSWSQGIKGVPSAATLEWETGSSGDELSRIATGSDADNSSLRIRCHSFLEAIEWVRRGGVSEAVVPDIYLRASEPDLVVEPLGEGIQGHLIAVYRTQDRARWNWLLDIGAWQQTLEAAGKAD